MNRRRLSIKIILIIDDDDTTRSFIENFLKESIPEYKLIFAAFGSNPSTLEALRRVNGDIDLISTDINHPGESGIEFIKACKEKYSHIPIIVCSGNAQKQDLEYMQDNDLMNMYFKKPFSVKKYIQVVSEIFQSQKIIRPVFHSDY